MHDNSEQEAHEAEIEELLEQGFTREDAEAALSNCEELADVLTDYGFWLNLNQVMARQLTPEVVKIVTLEVVKRWIKTGDNEQLGDAQLDDITDGIWDGFLSPDAELQAPN